MALRQALNALSRRGLSSAPTLIRAPATAANGIVSLGTSSLVERPTRVPCLSRRPRGNRTGSRRRRGADADGSWAKTVLPCYQCVPRTIRVVAAASTRPCSYQVGLQTGWYRTGRRQASPEELVSWLEKDCGLRPEVAAERVAGSISSNARTGRGGVAAAHRPR